jgi:glutamate--cysteine ligase
VLEECAPVAAALDAAHGGAKYRDALKVALAALRAAETVPSALVLDRMAKGFHNSYVRFIRAQSEQTRDTLLRLPFPPEVEVRFRNLAQESIVEQQRIEAADTMSFESYREKYLSTQRLGVHSDLTRRT